MLPTIDISWIGIALAIWTGLKAAFAFVMNALNWVSQKALAFFIGSKLWATAFFLAMYLGLSALCSSAMTAIFTWVSSLVSSSPSYQVIKPSIDFLNTVIPVARIAETVSFAFSLFFSLRLAQTYAYWFGRVWAAYRGFTQAWKT